MVKRIDLQVLRNQHLTYYLLDSNWNKTRRRTNYERPDPVTERWTTPCAIIDPKRKLQIGFNEFITPKILGYEIVEKHKPNPEEFPDWVVEDTWIEIAEGRIDLPPPSDFMNKENTNFDNVETNVTGAELDRAMFDCANPDDFKEPTFHD